jgi:hypothetical protein
VRQLVVNLSQQAENLHIAYQILLIDDASLPQHKVSNRELRLLPHTTYIELPQNIGRSAIRNLFLTYAKYAYLLFMDCDSQVENAHFLENYLKIMREKKQEMVVCGGRSYEKTLSAPEFYLRWYYGKMRECKAAAERNAFPYRSFMTNNFLISRSIFDKITFDTQLSGYGHEDTLFGYELKKQNIPLIHLDNSLIHIGLETNSEFLQKTTQGIENLYFIYKTLEKENDFISDVKLLTYFSRLKKYKLAFWVGMAFRISHFLLRKNIESRFASLWLFDFYKLGLFCNFAMRFK